MFHTDEDGNLAHLETLDGDVDKYALPEEEALKPLPVVRTAHRLPRPYTDEWRAYRIVLDAAKKDLLSKFEDEATRRAQLMIIANNTLAHLYSRNTGETIIRSAVRSGKASKMRNTALTLAAIATAGAGPLPRVAERREKRRSPTPEERETAERISRERIAAAEAKRARKAKKRLSPNLG
jgi:hypothetical protein